MQKGRGRVTASPAPGTPKFIPLPSFPTQAPALTTGQDCTVPNPPTSQHEKRANHPECVRQAKNTSSRQSLPQQRARAGDSFENRRPALKSPPCPEPAPLRGTPAAAAARTHLRPPRPRVRHGAVRACRVPSLSLGSSSRRSSPEQPKELPYTGPARRASGALPRPGPRARPVPAPLRAPRPLPGPDTAQGRDGYPSPRPGWA